MPAISLVVCVYKERDVLKRLLDRTKGVCDDLVVVHDGPEGTDLTDNSYSPVPQAPPAFDYSRLTPNSPLPPGYTIPSRTDALFGVRQLVSDAGGRYFEGPRCFEQEPHWPFAWSQATSDWILRLDADEFPSAGLASWLQEFRESSDPASEISGYTCIWPIWDGASAITTRWPGGRIFLFNRQLVRFFGKAEQSPIPDGRFVALDLILHHQPRRKSHGMGNVLMRRQAYKWRSVIAAALMGKPTDLPCWRWDNERWPDRWEEVRRAPLRTAFSRMFLDSLRTFRDQLKSEKRILLGVGLSGPLHHMLFCLKFWHLRLISARKLRL